ncbi:MAG: hypothetical protein PVS2B2_15370 [Candidatus Acidiferrum sp.]
MGREVWLNKKDGFMAATEMFLKKSRRDGCMRHIVYQRQALCLQERMRGQGGEGKKY